MLRAWDQPCRVLRVRIVCPVVTCSGGLVPLCDFRLSACLSYLSVPPFFVCRGFSVYGIVFRFLGLCVFYVFVWWIIIEKHTQIIKRQLCVCVRALRLLGQKGATDFLSVFFSAEIFILISLLSLISLQSEERTSIQLW